MKLNYKATHLECFFLHSFLVMQSVSWDRGVMMIADTAISLDISRFFGVSRKPTEENLSPWSACLKLGTVPKTVNGHRRLSLLTDGKWLVWKTSLTLLCIIPIFHVFVWGEEMEWKQENWNSIERLKYLSSSADLMVQEVSLRVTSQQFPI